MRVSTLCLVTLLSFAVLFCSVSAVETDPVSATTATTTTTTNSEDPNAPEYNGPDPTPAELDADINDPTDVTEVADPTPIIAADPEDDIHEPQEGVFGGEGLPDDGDNSMVIQATEDKTPNGVTLTQSSKASGGQTVITVKVNGLKTLCENSFVGAHLPAHGTEFVDIAPVKAGSNTAVFKVDSTRSNIEFQFYEPKTCKPAKNHKGKGKGKKDDKKGGKADNKKGGKSSSSSKDGKKPTSKGGKKPVKLPIKTPSGPRFQSVENNDKKKKKSSGKKKSTKKPSKSKGKSKGKSSGKNKGKGKGKGKGGKHHGGNGGGNGDSSSSTDDGSDDSNEDSLPEDNLTGKKVKTSGIFKAKGKRTATRFGGFAAPSAVHLAASTNPTEMKVTWTSGTTADPVVKYGSSSKGLSKSVKATTAKTYKNTDMCGGIAVKKGPKNWYDPGFFLTATMTGLNPGKRYYYKVCSSKQCSQTFSFTATPTSGTVAMYLLGDSGASTDVFNAMVKDYKSSKLKPAATIHVGDLAYGRGHTYMHEKFGAVIQPIAASMPYMVQFGNHEYGYSGSGKGKDLTGVNQAFIKGGDSGGECGVPTINRYWGSGNGNQMVWYSFNVGPAHVIMMSSEHAWGKKSAQYKFIAADLKAVDRKKTPFIIFAGHRPMYFAPGRSAGLIKTYESLFLKYHVHLAVWGHRHQYQSTCRIAKNRCVANGKMGTVHLTVGNGGIGRENKNKIPKKNQWLKKVYNAHGYSKVTLNSKSMTVVSYSSMKHGHKVMDKFTIGDKSFKR